MSRYKTMIPMIVLIICSSVMFGQFEKGKMLLGGDSKIDFSSLKNTYGNTSKATVVEISPFISFLVTDNLALGGLIQCSIGKEVDSFDWETKTNTYAIAPVIRMYLGDTSPTPFLQAEGGIGYAQKGDNNYTQSYNMSLVGVDFGLSLFINEDVRLELFAGYSYSKFKPVDAMISSFTIKGFSSGLGFIVIL